MSLRPLDPRLVPAAIRAAENGAALAVKIAEDIDDGEPPASDVPCLRAVNSVVSGLPLDQRNRICG